MLPWLWPEPQHTRGSFLILTENGDRVSPSDGAPSQMTAAEGGWLWGKGLSPQLLLQDLVAQQTVVFGDLYLMSSVLSRHCGQMALVE